MNVVPASPSSAASPTVEDAALSSERPFPGLRPFDFADRAFFFGREGQTFALYRLIEQGCFAAVIGSSGSGKSSLVVAGLCGLLAEESADPGGPNWVCLDMRPGAAPLSRLAKTLARLAANDDADESGSRSDRIEYRLRQSSFSFESALDEAGGLGGRALLLVVDQFEELFRFGLAGVGLRRPGIEETRAREEATQFVQIILDADRRRLEDVHLLVTMRSDFVGDCAYFHGLSEAVSATQYLVANLTRRQLEEAIRRPIEKAGGVIEPQLVQRLLNDCGAEFDQLPVLQHCLMRLWDRAGVASAGGPRRLTRQTYADIGRMSEALSRHADEILRECAGKEMAVEQTFRALAELDREGRATRRVLRFGQLLAETGVSESDLHAVLDRFRATTNSFLVPTPSIAPRLAPDDRVDIGHEALLSRWKKIAGDPEGTTGRPATGWLREEQLDGQRYRTLISLLDGKAGGEKATLADPDTTKRWWESRPRTAAWAQRYGGQFERVKQFIDESIAAKRRSRRNRLAGAFAIAGCVVAAGVWFAEQQMTEARLRREASDSRAIESQIVDSDRLADSGKIREALVIATAARDAAMSLTEADPAAPRLLQLQFDATIRVGAALETIARFDDARGEYAEAVGIAQRVVSLSDNETGEADLIDAQIKIGDIHLIRKQYSDALEGYRAGLSTCETALVKFPQSLNLLRNQGRAFYRIAEILKQQNDRDYARVAYQKALEIQKALVQRDPNNLSLESNLAATYTRSGALESDAGDLSLALSIFEQSVTLQEGLLQRDPTNPQWALFLTPTYAALADTLEKLNRPKDAMVYYQKAFDARDLAIRTLGDPDLQIKFADAAKALGDRSIGFARVVAYRDATRTWKWLLCNPKSESAAVDRYDDVIGFARAFDAAGDWPDAQTAYEVAKTIALRNLEKEPSDTLWKDKADAAEARAAAAAKALAPPPPASDVEKAEPK